MNEAEIVRLVDYLAVNPDAGDAIVGTGGCRKVRFAGRGKGKSGGYRIVTFYSGPEIPVFLFYAYSKADRSDLDGKQRNALKAVTKEIVDLWPANAGEECEMKKRKRKTAFDGILAGAKEALAYAHGEADLSDYRVHIPDDIDVKAIRKATKLTQEAFAQRYGFNLARLRDLEQRAYLLVIQKNPKAVKEALAA
jgi:hypothetical protein